MPTPEQHKEMMTDAELNRKIAELMGWRQHGVYWRRNVDGHIQLIAFSTDFLARERIHELLDLADEVLGEWELRACSGTYTFGSGIAESAESDECRAFTNRSHTIAHAIVAHKERP